MVTVKNVVCDYGIFENDELKLICNSRRNAYLIKAILDKDSKCDNHGREYKFNMLDLEAFLESYNAEIEEVGVSNYLLEGRFDTYLNTLLSRGMRKPVEIRIADDCEMLINLEQKSKVVSLLKTCAKVLSSSQKNRLLGEFSGRSFEAILVGYWKGIELGNI